MRIRGVWPLALMVLAGLAGGAALGGCGSAATATPMPTEIHGLPTVLGPVSGTGNETFTVTARPTMSIELICTGKGLDTWGLWITGGPASPPL